MCYLGNNILKEKLIFKNLNRILFILIKNSTLYIFQQNKLVFPGIPDDNDTYPSIVF